MQTKFHVGTVTNKSTPLTVESKDQSMVIVDVATVEEQSGCRQQVTTIDVENDEGIKGRFWVTVFIKNGRPVVEVATVPAKQRAGSWDEEKTVRKSVTGTFNLL